jgi:hypothetical protein
LKFLDAFVTAIAVTPTKATARAILRIPDMLAEIERLTRERDEIRDYHVNLPCSAVCARICFATCAVDFSSDGHTTAESLSHCSSYIHW